MTTPVGGLPLESARRVVEQRVLTDAVKIFIPGVFDPDTFEQTPDTIIWEGPGAILPDHGADVTVRLTDGQGTSVGTSGRYRMLTPISAPTPTAEHRITLTASKDPDAAGRIWTLDSVERTSTPVIRVSWLKYDTTLNNGS
ncbi:DUF6093 family protein [Streptomyces sp. NBC_01465]|uniref:DUF6093 family protein n=1 Tax=Streptomyces sp. NBC_01465 TaxID=2903878 RepID=UPI002E3737EE|nr:DUF6093 family protein [Streptomyces sp. NBC_01465]